MFRERAALQIWVRLCDAYKSNRHRPPESVRTDPEKGPMLLEGGRVDISTCAPAADISGHFGFSD